MILADALQEPLAHSQKKIKSLLDSNKAGQNGGRLKSLQFKFNTAQPNKIKINYHKSLLLQSSKKEYS